MAMQKLRNYDFIKYFWFSNGVDKLVGVAVMAVATGLFISGAKKETLSIPELVALNFAIVIIAALLFALYYYASYRSYLHFISGAKVKVTGGKDFLNRMAQSFWDGESSSSITFKVEVSKDADAEVRKAVTEFIADFIKRGNERFPLNSSAKGWEVKASVTVGKLSKFLLSELITNLIAIQSKFPTSGLTLVLSESGGEALTPRQESSDETWAEARFRHERERESHDNDFGGNHTHYH